MIGAVFSLEATNMSVTVTIRLCVGIHYCNVVPFLYRIYVFGI